MINLCTKFIFNRKYIPAWIDMKREVTLVYFSSSAYRRYKQCKKENKHRREWVGKVKIGYILNVLKLK